MKLQDITPDQVPGISGMYAGAADVDELPRLLTEPGAVLREAGLKIPKDATPAVAVLPRRGGGFLIIITVGDLLVAIISITNKYAQ